MTKKALNIKLVTHALDYLKENGRHQSIFKMYRTSLWLDKIVLLRCLRNLKYEVLLIYDLESLVRNSTELILELEELLTILAIGIIATVIFMFYAIIEVVNSGQIKTSEKIMWTICLIFLSNLTGFIYLMWGHKRILSA